MVNTVFKINLSPEIRSLVLAAGQNSEQDYEHDDLSPGQCRCKVYANEQNSGLNQQTFLLMLNSAISSYIGEHKINDRVDVDQLADNEIVVEILDAHCELCNQGKMCVA